MRNFREKIKKAMILFWINPLGLFKTFYFRIKPLPRSPLRKRINGVIFEFDFKYDPMIRELYYGTYEILTIGTMRRFLKKGDTFIDVGANIGYLSAIAMGFVGKSGQVHSFEPVPDHFNKLHNMAVLNPSYKIKVNQCAPGEKQGNSEINITNLPNIGWNTMVPGIMNKETIKETAEVSVSTLSCYIKEKELKNIALIKIDTEGYELPVLRGLNEYFINNTNRPAIICEIATRAYPLLGLTLSELSEWMAKYGYTAFSQNANKKIDIVALRDTTNVIFLPNVK